MSSSQSPEIQHVRALEVWASPPPRLPEGTLQVTVTQIGTIEDLQPARDGQLKPPEQVPETNVFITSQPPGAYTAEVRYSGNVRDVTVEAHDDLKKLHIYTAGEKAVGYFSLNSFQTTQLKDIGQGTRGEGRPSLAVHGYDGSSECKLKGCTFEKVDAWYLGRLSVKNSTIEELEHNYVQEVQKDTQTTIG